MTVGDRLSLPDLHGVPQCEMGPYQHLVLNQVIHSLSKYSW